MFLRSANGKRSPMNFAHTHAHRHDPDTSVEAARAAQGMADQHKAIIWTELLFFGDMTSQEIADKCELDYHQVARRMSEMKRAGEVQDSGERRPSPSGRRACVWRLV